LQRGFILGDTSAGAKFTAGIAHPAVQEGLAPALTGLLFLAGGFCHPNVRPEEYRDRILSVDEINDVLGLTRKSIDYFAAKYGAPPDDKRLSPLLFESHANLAKRRMFMRECPMVFGQLVLTLMCRKIGRRTWSRVFNSSWNNILFGNFEFKYALKSI
jgi:hypothetical protein